MPKVNPHADPTRRDLGPAALGRTVKKLFSYYPVLAPVTFVCILFSSIVSSVPSLFTQNIIQIIEKWYVSRDWAAAKAEIVPYLTLLVVLYALSILSMTVYTQLMAYMTQGFLHKLRCEMFGGMQKLPIRYFDSHQHGDIMSHYTNDIDTLRQLVSQALPALIQSGAIVLVVFSIMLYFSLWLTLVLVLGIIAMVAVTKKIGGGSAKYFVRQQKAVASTEGFIQEMMAGQKVVKVFCHEQKSIEDFDRLNDALFEDSFRAQAYASVLGPIIGNIGNILYVTLALVGGVFLLIGLPNVSLSGKALDISILVPFLNMARQFTGNVNQLSQQINASRHGGRGRAARVRPHRRKTRDGRRLCDACERRGRARRHRDRVRPPHRSLGVEAPAQRRHPHLHRAARRRAPHRCGLCLRPRARRCCTMSPFTPSRARRSPSSARPAQARRPSRTSSTAFTTLPTARSATTASTSTRSRRRICAAPSALCLQETNLFTGTVMENIRYGRLDATDEECTRGGKARRRGRLHHTPAARATTRC